MEKGIIPQGGGHSEKLPEDEEYFDLVVSPTFQDEGPQEVDCS